MFENKILPLLVTFERAQVNECQGSGHSNVTNKCMEFVVLDNFSSHPKIGLSYFENLTEIVNLCFTTAILDRVHIELIIDFILRKPLN